MRYTSKLGLLKPDQNDYYNIDNHNDNCDKIDDEFLNNDKNFENVGKLIENNTAAINNNAKAIDENANAISTNANNIINLGSSLTSHTHAAATTAQAGFLSAADKQILNNINSSYTTNVNQINTNKANISDLQNDKLDKSGGSMSGGINFTHQPSLFDDERPEWTQMLTFSGGANGIRAGARDGAHLGDITTREGGANILITSWWGVGFVPSCAGTGGELEIESYKNVTIAMDLRRGQIKSRGDIYVNDGANKVFSEAKTEIYFTPNPDFEIQQNCYICNNLVYLDMVVSYIDGRVFPSSRTEIGKGLTKLAFGGGGILGAYYHNTSNPTGNSIVYPLGVGHWIRSGEFLYSSDGNIFVNTNDTDVRAFRISMVLPTYGILNW